jgi:hypothetical protein
VVYIRSSQGDLCGNCSLCICCSAPELPLRWHCSPTGRAWSVSLQIRHNTAGSGKAGHRIPPERITHERIFRERVFRALPTPTMRKAASYTRVNGYDHDITSFTRSIRSCAFSIFNVFNTVRDARNAVAQHVPRGLGRGPSITSKKSYIPSLERPLGLRIAQTN